MNRELREKQREEAKRRLRILKVMDVVVNSIDEGKLYYSERMNQQFPAMLYWVSNKPELVTEIKKIEEEHDIFVYHVQLTHTSLGDNYSMLYVSPDEEEWESEREDLEAQYPLVYTWCGQIKEYGFLGIRSIHGGITRVE